MIKEMIKKHLSILSLGPLRTGVLKFLFGFIVKNLWVCILIVISETNIKFNMMIMKVIKIQIIY